MVRLSKGEVPWVEKLKAMPKRETRLVKGDNTSTERAWLDWYGACKCNQRFGSRATDREYKRP